MSSALVIMFFLPIVSSILFWWLHYLLGPSWFFMVSLLYIMLSLCLFPLLSFSYLRFACNDYFFFSAFSFSLFFSLLGCSSFVSFYIYLFFSNPLIIILSRIFAPYSIFIFVCSNLSRSIHSSCSRASFFLLVIIFLSFSALFIDCTARYLLVLSVLCHSVCKCAFLLMILFSFSCILHSSLFNLLFFSLSPTLLVLFLAFFSSFLTVCDILYLFLALCILS